MEDDLSLVSLYHLALLSLPLLLFQFSSFTIIIYHSYISPGNPLCLVSTYDKLSSRRARLKAIGTPAVLVRSLLVVAQVIHVRTAVPMTILGLRASTPSSMVQFLTNSVLLGVFGTLVRRQTLRSWAAASRRCVMMDARPATSRLAF